MLLERGGGASQRAFAAVCVGFRGGTGGIDRGLLNGGGGAGGSPFTCPRGSMAAHAALRPYSHPLDFATRTPRLWLQRVSSHAMLFQICPLNRLAAIQFAVLKAIKLGERAPVTRTATVDI